MADEPRFYIAGGWRAPDAGEAFSLLTTEPNSHVAPYHSRQIGGLRHADWSARLDLTRPLEAMPTGSLQVARQG